MSVTDYSDAFRGCLRTVDINTMRRLWAFVAPNMPQPETDEGIEISIHHARTLAQSIKFNQRAYSHCWLTERGLPSGLPDDMRPRAERLYPWIVPAVGISVNFSNPELKPLKAAIETAMHNAVLEVHADGKITDNPLVTARMREARSRVYKELMLPLRK